MIDCLLFNVKWKKFEDTKGVTISRDSMKDGQYSGQNKGHEYKQRTAVHD